MAYNYHQQVPFWDFIRSFDQQQQGAGVDHTAPEHFSFSGFPPPPPPPGAGLFGRPAAPPPPQFFGAGRGNWGPWGPWGGRGGHRGRHCRRPSDGQPGQPGEQPPNQEPREGEPREESPHHGPRHGCRRGGRGWNHAGRRGHTPYAGPGGFDMSGIFESLSNHPLAHAFRAYAAEAGLNSDGQRAGAGEDEENSFVPPVDIFSTEKAYILHVALPGAKKEDVGVNWDSDKGVLNIAGVIYRPGDEEFLKTMGQSERKVGFFDRQIKLPPTDTNDDKEEVDGEGIGAKLEDGVLVVTVPKVEKEWTEVKKVDIE